MSHLDHTGQALLERLAECHELGLFADVTETRGSDGRDTLSVTVDAARRLVGARVLDLDVLRQPEPFVDAVREAFAVADGERALASLERSGRREEFLTRADDSVSGRSPVRPPDPPDVSEEASLQWPLHGCPRELG